MTATQIIQFLQLLRSDQIHVKDNGWVTATCPLARWTHSKGHDSSPSFGVKVNEGGKSSYNCFACGTGKVEELLQALEMYSRGSHIPYDFKTAHQILADEQFVAPLPPYEEAQPKIVKFTPWPSWWTDQFLPVGHEPEAATYLTKREVPLTVWEHFNLRFDPHRKMIVAPYYTADGVLAGARGRSILDGVEGKNKHFDYTIKVAGEKINNCYSVWYNEQALHLDGPVVTVEGQFDCWRVWQVYPKVVAMLTARPTLEKMKKLCYSPLVVQIPDNDETGKKSVNKQAELCSNLNIPYRPAYMAPGPKDPDECQTTYLDSLIKTAISFGALS